MTTMLETLNETVAAYTEETRAVGSDGISKYLTPEGLMCAIGRCLIDPESLRTTNGNVYFLHDSHLGPLDSLLKPEYQGFPIDFWGQVQDLHDDPNCWDDEGLTLIGKTLVAITKRDFNLEDGQCKSTDPQPC